MRKSKLLVMLGRAKVAKTVEASRRIEMAIGLTTNLSINVLGVPFKSMLKVDEPPSEILI